MKTSLIVPAYNEEEALPKVIEEYRPYVNEIVIVDDGSTDNTNTIANTFKNESISVIIHPHNLGKVAALKSGINNASGDIVIFTDADCTYPAHYIPDFLKAIEDGADLVLGARVIERKNIPIINRLGNWFFSLIAGYISCSTISDSQTGYRAFKRALFPQLDVKAYSLEYETKMTVKAAKMGFRIVEIPIEYRKRVGVSKLRPFRDGIRMLKALLSVAWNETSMLAKAMLVPGFLFTILGLFIGGISIYERLTVYYLRHEYYPLIGIFLILLGIQIVSLGFIIDFLIKKLNYIEAKINKLGQIMDILIIIFAGLVCASTGQVFWKYGMNQIGQIDAVNINILIGMLFNPYVLAGIILYATSTLFWLIALSKKDLSFVYPFISLTFLMVLLLSYFVLKEQINLTRVVGTIIIITGLLVIVRN